MGKRSLNLALAVPVRSAQQREVSEPIPRAVWIGLGLLHLIVGAVAGLEAESVAYQDWSPHAVGCVIALCITLPILVRVLRAGFDLVLTDHRIMLLAAFALYFEAGALLYAIGPQAQIDVGQNFYPIGAPHALRADAVNSVGLGIALLVATFAPAAWIRKQADRASAGVARVPSQVVVGLLLFVGTTASIYTLSSDLGMVESEGLVPGIVRTASRLTLAAIFLAASSRGAGEVPMRVLAVLVTMLLAACGTLLFTKSGALLPGGALTAGLAVRFNSRKVVPIGLLLLISAYLALGNPTTYGRVVLGPQGRAPLSVRWDYLQEGWANTRDLRDDEGYSSWTRLCYLSPQAAAMDLHDAGQGGDGLELLPWLFVPRALFPNKPEITATGREFNEKITGSDTSASGTGIFVSGYYHAGWWGFVLASMVCGWILAQTSAIAHAVYSKGGLLMLPLAFIGLFIAFRVDGDIVADYIGAFVFVLYPLVVAGIFVPAITSLRGLSSQERTMP